MKDLLLLIIIVMLIYVYNTSYNNEYRINQLERAILKLNEMNNQLKSELSIYRVRQVNWFSQYEIQSALVSNDYIVITNYTKPKVSEVDTNASNR